MRGTSKVSRRSQRSSKRAKVGKGGQDSPMSGSAAASMDPPSSNLEVMANCVRDRSPLEQASRRKKIEESLILATRLEPTGLVEKNVHSRPSVDFVNPHSFAPKEATQAIPITSLDDHTKKESRHPSESGGSLDQASGARNPPQKQASGGDGGIDYLVEELYPSESRESLVHTYQSQSRESLFHTYLSPSREKLTLAQISKMINPPQKQGRGSEGGIGIGVKEEVESGSLPQRVDWGREGTTVSFSTNDTRSNESKTWQQDSRPPRTKPSSSSIYEFTMSSAERLEVLVIQLRETADEKEAATIILELALRIKNHELVVQGADHSIINAMKRFSNICKIQTRGCKALAEMASKGMPNIMSIIDKGGSEIILTAMAKHRAEEDLQKEACHAIECIAKDCDEGKHSFGANSKDGIAAILHAMKDHISAASLQRMACRALATIVDKNADCSQSLVNRGGLDAIRRTLKHHDDNTEVIENAFDILINVSCSVNKREIDEEIEMKISMDRILSTMLLYRKNDRMQGQGMALLCFLCRQSPRNRAKLATLYGLEVITKSLETCIVKKDVQRHGTKLIEYLCVSEGNTVAAGLVSDGGIELLLNIIRRHGSDPVIVQQVIFIVAKMAKPFSDTIRKEGGIELILSAMRRHEASARVQEAACLALWKLSAKTENANVITGTGGVALINNALARFPTDENISEVACEALASLSHDKQLLQAQQTLKARAVQKQKPASGWKRWNCGVSCF